MWETEKTWGFRLYINSRDPGTELTIQRMEEKREEVPIGPNALLKFIHHCISSVKLMVFRTKYDPIQSKESMI
jgi:hypothetical protein